MEDEKKILKDINEASKAQEIVVNETKKVEDTEKPLDKNIKLMSPGRMVLRRFFRSKLSITGLVMLATLFIFCWAGPLVYSRWGETESDRTGNITYTEYVYEKDGIKKKVTSVVADSITFLSSVKSKENFELENEENQE